MPFFGSTGRQFSMRRFTDFIIIGTSLALGVPYALGGHIWVLFASASVGFFWLLQSRQNAELGLNLCFLFLAGVCAAGTFIDHSPIWILTNMVLLLVTWNLDHFCRDRNLFPADMEDGESIKNIFLHRLKRLGVASALGWGLGLAALEIRVTINFSTALVLASILVISLAMFIRLLRRDDHREDSSSLMGP